MLRVLVVTVLSLLFQALSNKEIAAQNANEQTSGRSTLFRLGGYLGGNYLVHSANFNAVSGCPTCNPLFFGVWSGLGASVGAVLEVPLLPRVDVQVRAGANYTTSRFESPEFIKQNPQDPLATMPVEVIARHALESTWLHGMIEPAVSVGITEAFRAELGASIGIPLVATYTHNARAEGFLWRLPDGTASLDWLPQSGTLQNVATSIAVVGGLAYRLPLSETVLLTPFLRYALGLTDLAATERVIVPARTPNSPRVTESGSWRMSAVQFGLALTFDVRQPLRTETRYERDTTTAPGDQLEELVRLVASTSTTKTVKEGGEELSLTTIRESYVREIPRRQGLTVDLQVVGIGKDSSRQENPLVVIEEFESDEFTPLLPYLYFPEAVDNLLATRQNILAAPKDADKWSLKDIAQESLGVFSNTLNVLGYRMRRAPTSRLTITGCNANVGVETGDTALSMRRAQAVAGYLTKIWGISPKRLTLKAQNAPARPARLDSKDGMEENRRVELDVEPASILGPIENDNLTVVATPPTLEMTPLINAPAGLNWWYLSVKQRNKTLQSFSGSSTATVQFWQISRDVIGAQETPLTMTLQAEDASGRKGSVDKNVTIRQITVKKKRIEMMNDKRIDRFAFIMFDYDKSAADGANVQSLIETVKERIKPTSVVTITGYGDRNGSKQYNRELAARRCNEVKRLLQVPDNQVNIKAVGNEVLVQDNNVPEGRAYSRIVQITIETPITPGTPPRK